MLVRLFIAAFATVSVSGAPPAQIGLNHTEVVTCTIDSISGPFSSFIPPKVGDRITFDLKAPETIDLTFESGAYIPHSAIPKVPNPSPWRTHQAFYTLSPDPVFDDNIQVIIGAYGNVNDPLDQRVWSALIQEFRASPGSEWGFQWANLTCELVSL